MHNQKKACFFALLTVGIWSTVASAFKISLLYLSPLQLLFFSCLSSVLVLGLILGLQKKISTLFSLGFGDFKRSALLGLFNPFLYYIILFKAYDLLPAQEAQPLNYTWGITLALLSVPLLKQRIYPSQFVAIGISYVGVLIISTRGNLLGLEFSSPLGVGLALISTIIWALYWIANTQDKLEPTLRLFLNFCFGLLYITAMIVLQRKIYIPPMKGMIGAVYIGCFEMGISFVFWLKAMRYSENTAQISNFIYLSPFLSLIIIHYIVGEEIYLSTIIGLIFILIGIILQGKLRR